jgi:2-polyprenyl-3-methyl-5-hydroxy-6-metoxy-1,4-benzoquinol methylase
MTERPVEEFAAYTETHRQFLSEDLPPVLSEIVVGRTSSVVVDLGCGDGRLVWALERAGLVGDRIYAVDLAAERVARAERLSPRVTGIVADATSVPELDDESVDGVVCSAVIEHLEDDRLLAPEIARVLRPGGWFFVESLLRSPRSWWIYRRNGARVLDPTHVREYASEAEFVGAITHPELELVHVRSVPMRFPIADLGLRAAATMRLVSRDRLSRAYVEWPRLAGGLRSLSLRVPGYRVVSAAGRRR